MVTEYIIYALIGIVGVVVLFLLLRILLQIIFIKQCPRCDKTVSLAKSRICPRCGYDFNERRDPKFHTTVFFLLAAILGIGAFDVYSFQVKTNDYTLHNPYVSVTSITKEAQQEVATEMPTEAETGTEEALPETPPVETPPAEAPEGDAPATAAP